MFTLKNTFVRCVVVALTGAISIAHAQLTTTELAREGDAVPGAPGLLFGNVSGGYSYPIDPVVNASGAVLFAVEMVTDPPTDPVIGLFLQNETGLTLLAKQGDTIGASSATFERFSALQLADNETVIAINSDFINEVQQLLAYRNGAWAILAETGQSTGLGDGSTFDSFSGMLTLGLLIDHETGDHVLFQPTEINGGFERTGGVWSANVDTGTLSLVFRVGDLAPGMTGGETMYGFTSPVLSPGASGQFVFQGMLTPLVGGVTIRNSSGIWAGPINSPQIILRAGDPVPAQVGSGTFALMQAVSINGDGNLAINAVWNDNGTSRQAILHYDSGTLTKVVEISDILPGLGNNDDGPITSFREQELRINDQGQIFFEGQITPQSFIQYFGIYRWSTDNGIEVMAAGSGLGGAWPGYSQSLGIDTWTVNNAGQLAIFASLFNNFSYWITEEDGQLIELAFTESGSVYTLINGLTSESAGSDGRPRQISDNGSLIYGGQLTTTTDVVISANIPNTYEPDTGGNWFVFGNLAEPYVYNIPGVQGQVDGLELDVALSPFGTPTPSAAASGNFDGGTLLVEIVSGASADDRVGVNPSAMISIDEGGGIFVDAVEIGNLSRPSNSSMLISLNSLATPDRVATLMSHLVFGTGFVNQFENIVDHYESSREFRMTLSFGVDEVVVERDIEFPVISGIRIVPSGGGFTSALIRLDSMILLSNGQSIHIPANESYSSSVVWTWNEPTGAGFIVYPTDGFGSFIDATFQGQSAVPERGEPRTISQMLVSVSFGGFQDGGKVVGSAYNTTPYCIFIFIGEVADTAAFHVRYFSTSVLASSQSSRNPQLQNDPPNLLALFRTLSSWMSQSAEGSRLSQLYYQAGPEIVALNEDYPTIGTQFGDIVDMFLPGVAAKLDGDGSTFTITQEMIDTVNALADQIVALGSPELASLINSERAQFDNLENFVGKNMAEWGEMLAIGSPSDHFVALSSPLYAPGTFRAEANRTAG